MALKRGQDSLDGLQHLLCSCAKVLLTEDGGRRPRGEFLVPVLDSKEGDSQRHADSGGNGADFLQEPLARNNLFLLDGLHE